MLSSRIASGYKLIPIGGKWVREHRHIWETARGPIPRGMHIHHKDRDKLNNALENLELVPPHIHGMLHGKGANARHHSVRLSSEHHGMLFEECLRRRLGLSTVVGEILDNYFGLSDKKEEVA